MNSNFFKNILRKPNPIVPIVLLGSLLRFIAFLSLRPWDPAVVARHLLVSDQWSYNNIAISILNLDYGVESFWMPGWPAFIALVYAIFGELPWMVLLFNIGLGAIAIIYLYKAVILLIDRKTALIAGFLFACDPHQIIYSQTLLTENLFVPALIIFFYFLVRYIKKESSRHLIISSVVAGILVYIKSVALYFSVVPVAIVLFFGKDKLSVRLKNVTMIVLIVLAVHVPMSLKNYINDGYWAVTSNGGFNSLFIYAGSVYTNQLGYSGVQKDRLLQQKLDSMIGKGNTNQFDYDKAAKTLASQIIKEYPLEFLSNHLVGCVNIYTSLSTYQLSVVLGLDNNGLFYPGNYGASQFRMLDKFLAGKQLSVLIWGGVIALILIIEYSLALLGIISLFRKRRFKQLLIPLCFILYFTLITGVIGSSARFRLPISPFYLVYASVGIGYLQGRINASRQKKLRYE